MKELIARAEAGDFLSVAELVSLLTVADEEALFAAADRVRARVFGDGVHLRGIIEFSNICRVDCHYCGIRRSKTDVVRYVMSVDEIVAGAERAAGLGYATVVLQAGEGNALPAEQLAEAVCQIREKTGMVVTLSVGERSREEYALWRSAGAERYLLRHETSDPELFARLRPGHRLEDRVACLETLRDLGYQVGSGFMVGLPGQTPSMIAQDIELLRRLQVEMAGIGPFIPSQGTPLADAAGGTLSMTLRAVAVTRLAIPDAHLPATTAVGSIHPQGRQLALHAGCNVIMPNVTTGQYREQYQLYPGKICLNEEPEHCAPCVAALIMGEGRFVEQGPGHSPRWE